MNKSLASVIDISKSLGCNLDCNGAGENQVRFNSSLFGRGEGDTPAEI